MRKCSSNEAKGFCYRKARKRVILPLAVAFVSLLVLSSLSPTPETMMSATGAPVQDNDAGIWYDTFTDATGISTSDNISVADGDVRLNDSYPQSLQLADNLTKWWNNSYPYRRLLTIEGASSTLTDYQVRVDLSEVFPDLTKEKFRITYLNKTACVQEEISYWIENTSRMWVKVPKIEAGKSEYCYLYYGNQTVSSASNGTKTFIFFDDFTTNPNTNNKWAVYRFANDTNNEFYWDEANRQVYLTKAVDSKGVMAFFNKQFSPYGTITQFEYLAGGGSGADGFEFYFDKDKTPYDTYGRSSAGGSLASMAYDGSNGYLSEGYGAGFDNYQNSGEVSSNHLEITKTNSTYLSVIEPGAHLATYNTGITEDNVWHSSKIVVGSDFVEMWVDGNNLLSYKGLTALNHDWQGFGSGTGGADNNHTIREVRVRKYASPEPSVSVGVEEIPVTEGNLTSTAITPASLTSWKKFWANHTIPSQTNITYQILDASDGSVLLTVYASQAAAGYDISNITATSIKLFCKMSRTNTSERPMLHDWNVTWKPKIFDFGMLKKGWNSLTLPLDTGLRRASELASDIGTKCTHVARWTGTKFELYPGVDFELEAGVGYFVYLTAEESYGIDGTKWSNISVSLSANAWTLIGVTKVTETPKTAEDLAAQIPGCAAVAKWIPNNCKFVVHPVGTSVSNFEIKVGEGYLVFTTQVATWHGIV